MTGLAQLTDDEQWILEQAIDALGQLKGRQSRLEDIKESGSAHSFIHRTERSIVSVIEMHGEVR